MSVRIAFLADYPRVVPTIARWYFDEWGYREPGNSWEATTERLHNKLNRDRVPIPIVAVGEGDRVIGAAQLKLREMEQFPDREFWMGGVYVVPSARGQGVARALCQEIIGLSAMLGIQELWLQTEALDGGVYGRLGWSVVDRMKDKGKDIVVMLRKIEPHEISFKVR